MGFNNCSDFFVSDFLFYKVAVRIKRSKSFMKKEKVNNVHGDKPSVIRNQQKQFLFDKLNVKVLIGLVVIVLTGTLIYSNSFDCSFQFDDFTSIVNNPKIKNLSDIDALLSYNTRFIPYLLFALNYNIGQLDVWGYHLFKFDHPSH